ncbi:MAG TPA: HD domain-containing phosphohydrolase [Myxococcales bacterium]|jgi:HD-GYP domain-containing protein (c-di-GMP phosphodiesterase class II)|nr:HD domain-containing phosphohydrolase [Myxococcales bacterium]
MEFSLSGTVLTRDLVSADGRLVATRGEIVDLGTLKDVADKAPRGVHERPLFETECAQSILEAFEAPALQALVGTEGLRAVAADVLSEVRFPQAVWDELDALRREDAPRYQHAVWAAIICARLFRSALGTAPGLARLVGGALTHDVGMRHAALRLRHKRDHLTASDALALEDHPLLGALLLASVLGDAPAVHFALLHHTRAGYGYPRVQGRPPLRGLDVVAVASAFAALIAPRPYRLQAFNPRGAVDQLLEEASAGHFDGRAVRLLIHCMRGGRGAALDLTLPRKPTGFRPPVNHHGVSPESRATA